MTQALTNALPQLVRDFAGDNALLIDNGEISSREVLPLLGDSGTLGLGLPNNNDGRLVDLLEALEELAAISFSAAFAAWSHRATMEFLAAADTDHSSNLVLDMVTGKRPGSTAMASGFRALAGLGQPDLTARSTETGYRLNGRIHWASNLYPDATIVTTARNERDELLFIAIDVDTPGVSVADPLDLLAMTGTASTAVDITNVDISQKHVLVTRCEGFLRSVRPTFSSLQTAICIGLARGAISEVPNRLKGANSVFTEEVQETIGALETLKTRFGEAGVSLGTSSQAPPPVFLKLRLDAGLLVNAAAELDLKTAGGKAYLKNSPTNRRYRDAKFVPLQAPTEAQLRWELEQMQ